MATKIYDHITIDGDDAKLDGAVIKNLENNSEFSELKSGLGALTRIRDDSSVNGGVIEGNLNTNRATGLHSHAEGSGTTASSDYSHAEGAGTTASSDYSHAEGGGTTASGLCSHAGGGGTVAEGAYQTVIGYYNASQGGANHANTDYAFIIGNGTGPSNRSNALAVKFDGTFVFANGTEITPAQFASLLALLS